MDVEIFIKQLLSESERKKNLVRWYITRRLSDPFIASLSGGYQTLMIDDKRALKAPGVAEAKEFLMQFPDLRAIITVNYDMLIEYALGTVGFNYGVRGQLLIGRGKNPIFPWQGSPVKVEGEVSIAKIHGSISWDAEKNFYTDGRCGLRGDALIIPPSPEKTPPDLLREIWDLAKNTLLNTSHLLVFGFAFNSYDQAVLNLLEEGGVHLKSVLLVDIYPQRDRAKDLWPHANILDCEPPPGGLVTIKNWIRS